MSSGLLPGSQVGPWELGRKLGQGEYGEVFEGAWECVVAVLALA